MIEYIQGNIFNAEVQAIVNPVNCVGIMGKGLALEFKKRYPENYKFYSECCTKGQLEPGLLCVSDYRPTARHVNTLSPHGAIGSIWGELCPWNYIVNLPTKNHWRDKSEMRYIEMGLRSLQLFIQEHEIKSIALPKIGCGLGGLDFEDVKPIIERELDGLECRVEVYI